MTFEMSPGRSSGNGDVVEHALGQIRTFVDELKNGTRNYRTTASLEVQIAEAYRGRCVLELLQNGHDALGDTLEAKPGLITFSLSTAPVPVLLIANSGRPFERKDFKGLCQLGQSPKDPNKSVGNKGLGFRSVLEVASAPEIWSTASIQGGTAYAFRFDPAVGDEVAAAIGALDREGLEARSPFDSSMPLVGWSEDELAGYRRRVAEERVDGPSEARRFMSPYDVPLPIEGRRPEVDELLHAGHVTVIRLPLDGGQGGSTTKAVASVKAQLEALIELSTTLFLPRVGALVVDIDGGRSVVRRTVEADAVVVESGARCQTVRMSRTGTNRDDDATGRYRVWTRTLGGAGDSEGAARIRAAVQTLPNKWPEVDRAEVGVAVREGLEPDRGRFVIFLPTAMATGTGAHFNAPFFGSLDRKRFEFGGEYNTLLLGCVVDLCLDAVDDLSTGEPERSRGRALVDILGMLGDIGDDGPDLLEMVRERAEARGEPLEDRALVLCEDGWATAAEARAMPPVPAGLAVRPEDWRRAAAFPVVSGTLRGREHRVQALVDGLGGSLSPTDAEWSQTVASLAELVQSGEVDSGWDGFLTSLLEVLPPALTAEPKARAADPLASIRFLPGEDGRLVSAADEVRVFFQPVRGVDDEALVDTVPESLKGRIAFLHGDVRTHEEGSQRRRTPVHKFLDDRFAGGFLREEIVRDVVLEAVPPLPVAFGSAEADLCSELLGWTTRLLPEEPSDALLSLLSGLPLACHGGWYASDEAVFGPGWAGDSGDDLWELAAELGDAVGGRMRRTALLPPGDSRWGLDVGRSGDLFAQIGVAKGLRLSLVDPVRFRMQTAGHELPREAPAGVDQDAWERWCASAREEAKPRHLGEFEYSLEGVHWLPEATVAAGQSRRARQALSRLVLDSMRCWRSGWQQATIRKVHGQWSTWQITSPLTHWLSTRPWLADGSGAERALPARWHVPASMLQGQQDRFHHLRPLTLGLARRLDDNPNLANVLQTLGLNFYPTEEERIGPALLDALAAAWRAQPELAARFNVFLGQVRHAWQHFEGVGELPEEFLVRTERRRFEVVDREGLGDVFLPDDVEKGRSIWESGKGVLEMPVRDANRLGAYLVEATGIRRASSLEERVLIDGVEWTRATGAERRLEDTRYRWLPAPMLAVAAYGGPQPTGAATKGWMASVGRLRGADLLECESIVVELVAGEEAIATDEQASWWLPGDVLAVTRETGAEYEQLATALEAMLDRQDLLKDLRLVLGAVAGSESPSDEEIERALDRAEIDAQTFADVRSHWAGSAGLLADRVRPVAGLLGCDMDEFESAALDADRLTGWLGNNLPQWEPRSLISAARRSRDDHAMGVEAWHALGEVAQLPAWNATLEQLGDGYETVANTDAGEQISGHMEAVRPLLQALSRHVAIRAAEPDLFPRMEEAFRDLEVPDDWPKRWWDVPFSAVVGALYGQCRDAVAGLVPDALPEAESADELRDAMVASGMEIDVDPYQTARFNSEKFGETLLEVHDLHRTWVEVRAPESAQPDRPTPTELGPEAYLRRWSEAELWRRAMEVLGDDQFRAVCGNFDDPRVVRERLGLDEAVVATKRRERMEQEKASARQPKKMEIAGQSFEIETIDYGQLLSGHLDDLEKPAGPHAKDDEFTPLGAAPGTRGGPGGGGKRKNSHRRLPPEEAQVVGVVGESHAYRFLRKEFGGHAVQARAWVSETRLKVFPLVAGEADRTSDGHGFDFRFSHKGIGWRVEVKATKGDEASFDLGITEIQAATEIARRASDKLRWRILRVRNALSKHPEFDWLPNPFEDGFRSRFRLRQGGMLVSYVRRRG